MFFFFWVSSRVKGGRGQVKAPRKRKGGTILIPPQGGKFLVTLLVKYTHTKMKNIFEKHNWIRDLLVLSILSESQNLCLYILDWVMISYLFKTQQLFHWVGILKIINDVYLDDNIPTWQLKNETNINIKYNVFDLQLFEVRN